MNEEIKKYAVFKLKDHASMMEKAYLQRSISVNRYHHGAFMAIVDILKAAGINVGFEMGYKKYKRTDVSEIYHIIEYAFVDGKPIYEKEGCKTLKNGVY